ncbi:Agamous-like mads-box protein agl80 [Thalictrum thalictroides]|uniref:Agamous-like mads-box protein agl80 n=1 Tax=Thalictrum thalictroides TaxID=46969 RepID=A0A7J6X548_THATH|nr:Agamous-like mads-box protein agl80 [Thalictrum thalictroides]
MHTTTLTMPPRGMVKLALIKNNSARRTCFRKRKSSLLKKVRELSILCGVEACAIIMNGPNDPNPAIWPSPQEAQGVINRFKSMPSMEKSKRMIIQEDYLKQRIKKMEELVKEQQFENRKLEMTKVMYQNLDSKRLEGMRKEDLADLAWVIQEKEKKIQKRIAALMETTPIPQLIAEADGMDVVPEQSLLMEGMNSYPPTRQQLPPPPNGYNGEDVYVRPPPNGYYGGDAFMLPPFNGYYGGDAYVMPPPNSYYGGDVFAMPPPGGYYGGQAFVMPPPTGYYGGQASVMPPPNGYYGGHASVMPAYGGYYFPKSNGYYP